mmetsp:Transcript_24375/g.36162  ORF Transcript_24375/g.36162 Transcript_24375/m.36162 type:complete len:563 (-) Transcript_24375:2793-4481(-)
MPSFFKKYDDSKCNSIVMSESGKPIFWRFGQDEEILTICGVVQALRTNLSDDMGEIQFLKSTSLSIVFMVEGCITLIAVSKDVRDNERVGLLLKLQLEFLYGLIIFTLTEQVQTVLRQNPNYNIMEALESSESSMNGILDQAACESNPVPFLTGGIDVVGPISYETRKKTYLTLHNICQDTPDTVFAILFVGEKLLSFAQPSYISQQLQSSDLKLLIKFTNNQPGLTTSELWFPVCLPRFNSTGFLNVYGICLNERTKLSLVLISQVNSTVQFQLFREAATNVRSTLELPIAKSNILKILEKDSDHEQAGSVMNNDDVSWKRINEGNSPSKGPATENGDGAGSRGKEKGERKQENGKKKLDHGAEVSKKYDLLQQISDAINPDKTESLMRDYMALVGGEIMHFVFRLDSKRRATRSSHGETSYFSQCLSPSLNFPFVDIESKRRVWSIYQKLCLRLRLGAATTEAMKEEFSRDDDCGGDSTKCNTWNANVLVESTPDLNGITYETDETEIFLAMNGRGFELYAIFPATISVKAATSSGAKLARLLLSQSKQLFLTSSLNGND